jgi:hypothetical protein
VRSTATMDIAPDVSDSPKPTTARTTTAPPTPRRPWS